MKRLTTRAREFPFLLLALQKLVLLKRAVDVSKNLNAVAQSGSITLYWIWKNVS